MKEETKYDLEERTLEFSKRVIRLCKALPKNNINLVLSDQSLRSATAIGANYREANDALGEKDFVMRVKIARKEAKESKYWLELIIENNPDLEERIRPLLQENIELIKILSAIIQKVEAKHQLEI